MRTIWLIITYTWVLLVQRGSNNAIIFIMCHKNKLIKKTGDKAQTSDCIRLEKINTFLSSTYVYTLHIVNPAILHVPAFKWSIVKSILLRGLIINFLQPPQMRAFFLKSVKDTIINWLQAISRASEWMPSFINEFCFPLTLPPCIHSGNKVWKITLKVWKLKYQSRIINKNQH